MTERTPKSTNPVAAGRARTSRVHRCPITRRALRCRHRIDAVCIRDRCVWMPALVTVLVLATALVAQSPLRDAVAHGDVSGVHLAIGARYALLAPFCALLDMQSLLTVPQHIAVVVTLLLGFIAWRVRAFMRSATYPSWGRELAGLVLVLLLPVGLVVINVLVPRPMARLVVDDPEVVAVDVHAHTASSHDGRPDWTQERVRRWHAASGFNVAYITDHKRFGGAIDGMATNPARAGDGVVLLSGLELRSGGQHVNVLSMTSAESVYVVDGDHLTKGIVVAGGREALIVQTIPFTLDRFAGPGQDTLPRTNAIEINDGAPRGLTVGLTKHAALLRLADSLNLALVAGSDNHGWGNTASGWTLVRVPGWRSLTPLALAGALEAAMLKGRSAAQVVERRTPLLVTKAQVAATVPVMAATVLRGLTPTERVSWIAWAWSALALRVVVRRMALQGLARARAVRARRRARLRVVPIATVPGLQG